MGYAATFTWLDIGKQSCKDIPSIVSPMPSKVLKNIFFYLYITTNRICVFDHVMPINNLTERWDNATNCYKIVYGGICFLYKKKTFFSVWRQNLYALDVGMTQKLFKNILSYGTSSLRGGLIARLCWLGGLVPTKCEPGLDINLKAWQKVKELFLFSAAEGAKKNNTLIFFIGKRVMLVISLI